MPLETFVPPVLPSPGTSHKPEVSLWEAEFGDGYSQPTPKGINHIRKKVSLSWEALTEGEMLVIRDFFERHQGCIPFRFKPYGERDLVKWTCKDWSAAVSGGVWKMQAELSQSFSHMN